MQFAIHHIYIGMEKHNETVQAIEMCVINGKLYTYDTVKRQIYTCNVE